MISQLFNQCNQCTFKIINLINLIQMAFLLSMYYYFQAMGCEGACAHARVRCAVARVRVRAKRLLKHVCDVRACGHF